MITIIFGSPRKNGNTASLLAPFVDELDKNQAQYQVFDVYEKNIHGCRACLGCQKDTEHICCVINDDMQSILSAVALSELVVFAAPIYLWSAPAPVKAVMDRLVYSSCKYYGGDPHGAALLEGKRFAILTTCGYPEDKAADLYQEQMIRFAKHCKASYAGMLVERQKNLRDSFMNQEKEEHARKFASALLFDHSITSV